MDTKDDVKEEEEEEEEEDEDAKQLLFGEGEDEDEGDRAEEEEEPEPEPEPEEEEEEQSSTTRTISEAEAASSSGRNRVARASIRHIELPDLPCIADNEQVMAVKIPKFLKLESDAFDREEFLQNGTEQPRGAAAIKHTIRWRHASGNSNGNRDAQSNARFVRWSDGSAGLFVGDQYFEATEQDVQNRHMYLYVEHDPSLGYMESQGRISTRMMFRSTSVSQIEFSTLSKVQRQEKKARIVADDEGPLERERLAKLEADAYRSRRALENMRRADRERHSSFLTKENLERDSDGEDEDAAVVKEMPRRYAASAARAASSRREVEAEEDEEEDDDDDEEDADYTGEKGDLELKEEGEWNEEEEERERIKRLKMAKRDKPVEKKSVSAPRKAAPPSSSSASTAPEGEPEEEEEEEDAGNVVLAKKSSAKKRSRRISSDDEEDDD